MIGDKVTVDGATFTVRHVMCNRGLVHAALQVNPGRLYAPHHGSDGAVYFAEWTTEPVLTCFICVNHVWQNTPVRDRFSDVDD